MVTIDAFVFGGNWDTALPPGCVADQEYGPLLLWHPELRCWVIGRWDGEDWCDSCGGIFSPSAWAPLPLAPHEHEAPGNVGAAFRSTQRRDYA